MYIARTLTYATTKERTVERVQMTSLPWTLLIASLSAFLQSGLSLMYSMPEKSHNSSLSLLSACATLKKPRRPLMYRPPD